MYVLLWSICRGGDDKKGGLLGKKKFVTPRQTVNKNNLLHYLTQLPGVFICGLLRWSTDLLRLASRYPWYGSLVRRQAGNHASLHTVLMNAHTHTETQLPIKNFISKTVWKYVDVFCYHEVLYNRIGAQQRAVKAVQPFPDDRLVLR